MDRKETLSDKIINNLLFMCFVLFSNHPKIDWSVKKIIVTIIKTKI